MKHEIELTWHVRYQDVHCTVFHIRWWVVSWPKVPRNYFRWPKTYIWFELSWSFSTPSKETDLQVIYRWAQFEEGVSVCRTRCTGSFLAGRSINRNGAPPFNPGQAPESAIKKEQQRSQGLHKPQSGESLKLLENPAALPQMEALVGFGSLTSDAGRLTWHWKPIRKISSRIAMVVTFFVLTI